MVSVIRFLDYCQVDTRVASSRPGQGNTFFLEIFSFDMLTVSFEIGNTKKLMPPKNWTIELNKVLAT